METLKQNKIKAFIITVIFLLGMFAGLWLQPKLDKLSMRNQPIEVIQIDADSKAKEAIRNSQEMQDLINIAVESKLLDNKRKVEQEKKIEAEKAENGFAVKYDVEKDRLESAFGALVGDENSKEHIESIKKVGNMPKM